MHRRLVHHCSLVGVPPQWCSWRAGGELGVVWVWAGDTRQDRALLRLRFLLQPWGRGGDAAGDSGRLQTIHPQSWQG